MKPVKIFVEGRLDKKKNIPHSSDSRLLRDCVHHWFGKDLDLVQHFEYIGGASEIILMTNQIKLALESNYEVLVVIDANGNPAIRKAEVESFQQQTNLSFPFFLFPDNNNKGEVETLIEIVATKRKLLGCYTTYENCIGKKLDIK